jgi:hypothetical protein
MTAYSASVTADTTITWDSSTVAIPAGSVLLVEPRSALETAIGTSNLAVISSDQDLAGMANASH